VEIDLLTVDCEGMDAVVLQSSDWKRYRPAFVMVEDAAPLEDSPTALLLREQGYELAARVQITKIYKRRAAGD